MLQTMCVIVFRFRYGFRSGFVPLQGLHVLNLCMSATVHSLSNQLLLKQHNKPRLNFNA